MLLQRVKNHLKAHSPGALRDEALSSAPVRSGRPGAAHLFARVKKKTRLSLQKRSQMWLLSETDTRVNGFKLAFKLHY